MPGKTILIITGFAGKGKAESVINIYNQFNKKPPKITIGNFKGYKKLKINA